MFADDLELSATDAAPDASPEYLWYPYFPFGSIAVLDGDPGVGKSFLAIDLAARLTAGATMPDGQPGPVRPDGHRVMIVNGEDDIDTTLIPRFRAAGGDLSRLTFFGGLRQGKRSRVARFPDDG